MAVGVGVDVRVGVSVRVGVDVRVDVGVRVTVAVVVALGTGWLGGELVDRLGVGVDDGANLNAPSSLAGPR